MRSHYVLVGALVLAGCGGGGVNSIGSSAAPTGAGTGGTTVGSGTTSADTFVNPTMPHTYSAIGGVQSYQYLTTDRTAGQGGPVGSPTDVYGGQGGQLYAADASTARNSDISVSYDPRSAIFEIKIASGAAGVDQTIRFQDPAHRTDFGGAREPQIGAPDISGQGIQYLQVGSITGGTIDPASGLLVANSGDESNIATFFYQKPGTTTQYVTFAGFMRNATSVNQKTDAVDSTKTYLEQSNTLERAAFAFGQRTDNSAVPTTGTASFSGGMLATMVFNPLIDSVAGAPTYYQWVSGNSQVNVDFSSGAVTTNFTGTVFAPQIDFETSQMHVLPAGSTFTAAGTARIDLPQTGGFVGQINSASFTTPTTISDPRVVSPTGGAAVAGATIPVSIAGSSVDGAFYGPKAEEVGGGFRIVGGTPDERIDMLGTFTGAKPR